MKDWTASLRDARHFQILGLAAILAVGLSLREFDIPLAKIAAILGACLLTQWLGSISVAVRFDWRSSLITALSLILLARAGEIWPLIAASAIAIGSKFALRLNGKHVFNPANAGLVAMLLFTDMVWTTPGQWGTALWFATVIAGAGSIVTVRASRLDVPLMFLATYAAILFARALYLGDPLAIPMLRLQSGALILFAFFMISDPKTTPDGFRARLFFSAATAALAYVLQYHFFETEGLFYALAIMCLIRPAIEIFDPAPRYQWGDAPAIAPRRRPALKPAE